jgi:hypothetical protein
MLLLTFASVRVATWTIHVAVGGFSERRRTVRYAVRAGVKRVAMLVSQLQLRSHLCERQVNTRRSEQLLGGYVRSQFVRLLDLSSTPEPPDEQNYTPLRCYIPADCSKICPVAEISGYLAHFKILEGRLL